VNSDVSARGYGVFLVGDAASAAGKQVEAALIEAGARVARFADVYTALGALIAEGDTPPAGVVVDAAALHPLEEEFFTLARGILRGESLAVVTSNGQPTRRVEAARAAGAVVLTVDAVAEWAAELGPAPTDAATAPIESAPPEAPRDLPGREPTPEATVPEAETASDLAAEPAAAPSPEPIEWYPTPEHEPPAEQSAVVPPPAAPDQPTTPPPAPPPHPDSEAPAEPAIAHPPETSDDERASDEDDDLRPVVPWRPAIDRPKRTPPPARTPPPPYGTGADAGPPGASAPESGIANEASPDPQRVELSREELDALLGLPKDPPAQRRSAP
jgi:hypothetical protein